MNTLTFFMATFNLAESLFKLFNMILLVWIEIKSLILKPTHKY